MSEMLRRLPAVDTLLSQADDLLADYGRDATVNTIRAELDDLRRRILDGETVDLDHVLDAVAERLEDHFQPTLRPVINATGVIIHTNLGRAPLSQSAVQAMHDMAAYSTLEYDLEQGKRGNRLVHASNLLAEITGAEAAMVVNNNAAATVLMLSGLAQGREVIVSRGQLVEIGGGFRVPEIMAQSGATLVEVGTTNRTRAADFARAISENTALLMRVHSSNFKQIGFTEQPTLPELAQLAHQHHLLLLVEDQGSGALLDTAAYGLDHEPMPQEAIAGGCDLVTFSGDKLLGGPQAGLLVGKREIIDRLKRHPLARAIRADKTCLSALTATLDHYRRGDALDHIPVWQMIARPLDDLRQTAQSWAETLRDAGRDASVVDGESTVGGGSLPGETLPTVLVALRVDSPDRFLADLRRHDPPIIARIADDRVLIDPRTVLPEQVAVLLQALG